MTYFVSDIHGQYELFIKLLSKIGFSSSDEMYVLGDIIDKGRGSVKLIKYIMEMPNIHCIKGNHEHILLNEYYSLMEDEAKDFDFVISTLQNHFDESDERLTFEMIDWLESLPYYVEGDDFIAVHAGVPIDESGHLINPEDALAEQLIYDRYFKNPDYAPIGDKCVIFGHTPTVNVADKPVILAYKKKGTKGDKLRDFCKIHIDTDTWGSHVLGCFCKEKLSIIYAKV